jgi:hypothetical protein
MHPLDENDVSWALALHDACDSALNELGQVQGLLHELREDNSNSSTQASAARLLSSRALALQRSLEDIEVRIRRRYSSMATGPSTAGVVKPPAEDTKGAFTAGAVRALAEDENARQELIDAKLELSERLGEDWRRLANALGISRNDQRRFAPGHEAEEIWEWLEWRKDLNKLKPALIKISRKDLADGLPPELG